MAARAFPAPLLHVLAAAAGSILLLQSLRGFLSAIYYHNLEALGLNATAALALLLLAPALLAIPAVARGGSRVLLAAAALLVVARVLMHVTWSSFAYLPVSGFATAAGLVLLPLLLVAARRNLGEGASMLTGGGVVLAVAFDAASLFAGDSKDWSQPPRGVLFTGPLALLVVLALVRLRMQTREALSDPRREPESEPGASPRAEDRVSTLRIVAAGAGFGAWLFLVLAVFGSPFHVARWNEASPAAVATGIVLGFVLGLAVAWAIDRGARRRAFLIVAGIHLLALLAVADHVLLHSRAIPILLAPMAASLAIVLMDVLRALARASPARVGASFAMGGFVALVLLFAFAFSFTFAFVPLGDLWKGAERVLVPLGALLAVGSSLLLRARDHAGTLSRDAAGRPPRRLHSVGAALLPRPAIGILLAIPLLVVTFAAVLPDAAPEPPQDGTIRILAFNVHQGFNNDGVVDSDAFLRVIRDEDADVVALQESDTTRFASANVDVVHYLASRLGYHAYHGPPTREQSFGISILSRFPIEAAEHVPITSFSDNRFIAAARLRVAGSDVWILTVHMGLPLPDRDAQIGQILAYARGLEGQRILAGDFNSCPNGLCPSFEDGGDDVYARVTSEYVDTWAALGRDAEADAALTWPAASPSERLDYVFVTPGLRVLDARVVDSRAALAASDHRPVFAEVTLAADTRS